MSWEAQEAPAWERVRSLCGQRHGCRFVFLTWRVLEAGICGLGCGEALEVGGTKSNGTGSTRVTVLDGGAEQSTVGCKGDVPDKLVLIGGVPRKSQVSAWYGGGNTVRSVLAKWAPAGDVRLLWTRRRGKGQAVSAAGGGD